MNGSVLDGNKAQADGGVIRRQMFALLIKQVLNPTEWTKSHSSTLNVCSFSDISLFESVLEPPITNYRRLSDCSQTLQVSIILLSELHKGEKREKHHLTNCREKKPP